jgi:mannose-6-phosphate isomerase
MYLHKLDNVIQNYPWGSKSSFSKLFNVPNLEGLPQAELWMGAHPNGCSQTFDGKLLSEIIASKPRDVLGERSYNLFGELPFLFKVLAAEAPLSIQVHPNKAKSELGFARENSLGISLGDPKRNYKDPNHKPELVYALTPYKAINGFRPIAVIVELFEAFKIDSLSPDIQSLAFNPTSEQLKEFFHRVMSLSGSEKEQVLMELLVSRELDGLSKLALEAKEYIEQFNNFYPSDIGILAPLMFNTIELQPGEAMFLYAETPHAYVSGTALEIMANSDNVLRAGLTPKHIDVLELIDNTKFEPIAPKNLLMEPENNQGRLVYPVPVEDFSFDIVYVELVTGPQQLNSAEILFCLEGNVAISSGNEKLTLAKGESIFISCDAKEYLYSGQGIIARAYN